MKQSCLIFSKKQTPSHVRVGDGVLGVGEKGGRCSQCCSRWKASGRRGGGRGTVVNTELRSFKPGVTNPKHSNQQDDVSPLCLLLLFGQAES